MSIPVIFAARSEDDTHCAFSFGRTVETLESLPDEAKVPVAVAKEAGGIAGELELPKGQVWGLKAAKAALGTSGLGPDPNALGQLSCIPSGAPLVSFFTAIVMAEDVVKDKQARLFAGSDLPSLRGGAMLELLEGVRNS